jgi:hypothetical protein
VYTSFSHKHVCTLSTSIAKAKRQAPVYKAVEYPSNKKNPINGSLLGNYFLARPHEEKNNVRPVHGLKRSGSPHSALSLGWCEEKAVLASSRLVWLALVFNSWSSLSP